MGLRLIKFSTSKRRRPARLTDPDMRKFEELRREHPRGFDVLVQLAEDLLADVRPKRPSLPEGA